MISAPAKTQPPLLPKTPPSAENQLRELVRARLRASGYRELWDLDCDVHDGRVILFGVVPSYYMKQVAQTIVLQLHQVDRVENRLRVD